jgi:hypothetical protein
MKPIRDKAGRFNAEPKELTVERVRELLEQAAPRAQKLLEELNAAHLRGMSRSMKLRLD